MAKEQHYYNCYNMYFIGCLLTLHRLMFYRYTRFLVGKSKKHRVTDRESNDFADLYINLNGGDMSVIIIVG